MSKGFIGLDNPSFQGNLRTYRRRHVAEPRKPKVKQVGVLDDSENSSAQVKSQAPQPLLAQQKSVKKQSPLFQPAGHSSSAGTEFVATITGPIAKKKELSRAEKFQQWQQQQYLSQRPKNPTPTSEAFNHIPEEPDSNDIAQSLKQIAGTVAPAKKTKNIKSKRSLGSIKSRIPLFGKLNRKDVFTMKFALPAMAVAIFMFGCGVALQGVLTNKHVQAQVAELTGDTTGYDSEGREEVPDETVPDEKNWGPYVVAPNMPKYIRIGKLGVVSRVQRVGVKSNNELIAPNNIHTVGWYEGSTLPGEEGTALLDAHVHGPTMPGAFHKIHTLSPGDDIEIEMGDGRKFYYSVANLDRFPYQNTDMAKAMKSAEDGKNGLNLITCGGKYNRSTKTYEERIVVYAVQK